VSADEGTSNANDPRARGMEPLRTRVKVVLPAASANFGSSEAHLSRPIRVSWGARRRKADFQFLSARVEQLTSFPGDGVISAPILRRGALLKLPDRTGFLPHLGHRDR
jgi:hypothetical protein